MAMEQVKLILALLVMEGVIKEADARAMAELSEKTWGHKDLPNDFDFILKFLRSR